MGPGHRPAGQGGGRRWAEEEVLVVPRSALLEAGVLPAGFSARGWERCLELIARRGAFVRRGPAEEDPSRKQIIPYAVVMHSEEVFLFRRRTGGSEARLHGKYSIGVGGHINPESVPPERLLEAALVRELEEELLFQCPYRYHPVGLINDEGTAVGQVHLGVVYLVTVEKPEVRVREEEVLEGRFASLDEVRGHLEAMESWSRLVAEALYFGDAGSGLQSWKGV